MFLINRSLGRPRPSIHSRVAKRLAVVFLGVGQIERRSSIPGTSSDTIATICHGREKDDDLIDPNRAVGDCFGYEMKRASSRRGHGPRIQRNDPTADLVGARDLRLKSNGWCLSSSVRVCHSAVRGDKWSWSLNEYEICRSGPG